MLYKRKPQQIKAIQFNGENAKQLQDFIKENGLSEKICVMFERTLEPVNCLDDNDDYYMTENYFITNNKDMLENGMFSSETSFFKLPLFKEMYLIAINNDWDLMGKRSFETTYEPIN